MRAGRLRDSGHKRSNARPASTLMSAVLATIGGQPKNTTVTSGSDSHHATSSVAPTKMANVPVMRAYERRRDSSCTLLDL
jgi:hypothetical protein